MERNEAEKLRFERLYGLVNTAEQSKCRDYVMLSLADLWMSHNDKVGRERSFPFSLWVVEVLSDVRAVGLCQDYVYTRPVESCRLVPQ